MAAAGTAGLHASDLLTMDDNKIWSVSATLRGFYDDNYLTATHKVSSLGFEVSPGFQLEKPFQQTELGLRYTYGLFYYQKREQNGQNPIDQTHQFDLWIDHAFTSRWELQFGDTVRVAQDPALTTGPVSTAQRVEGNNLQNSANISLHTDWTRLLATQLSYQNTYVSYENSGAGNVVWPAVTPSYAGLLDSVQQTFGIEGQWKYSPETVGMVGYMFGLVNFTGDEPIAPSLTPGVFYTSSVRDNRSHYGYVGVQHKFLENLSGSAKVGVQYTTYYNDPNSTSSFGPYADMSLNYTYSSGAYAQVGFTESRNSTDAVQLNSKGQITQDQESSVIYASINHPLTAKLMGSVVGHYQHSIYHDGGLNNQSADFYNLGLNLDYQFTPHFSSDVGYNFDYYTSPAGGDYTRNRLYLGVTASF